MRFGLFLDRRVRRGKIASGIRSNPFGLRDHQEGEPCGFLPLVRHHKPNTIRHSSRKASVAQHDRKTAGRSSAAGLGGLFATPLPFGARPGTPSPAQFYTRFGSERCHSYEGSLSPIWEGSSAGSRGPRIRAPTRPQMCFWGVILAAWTGAPRGAFWSQYRPGGKQAAAARRARTNERPIFVA
jgi:hypothetical protein